MIIDFRNTFLSNFWECKIEYEGVLYPSAEHAYVGAKTNNIPVKHYISTLPSPGRAKQFGRQLVLREDWDEIKVDVMREILQIKFKDLKLRQMLDETAPKYLIEVNTWGDTFCGAQQETPIVYNEECFTGLNWLGRLLMEIRDANTVLSVGGLLHDHSTDCK